MSNRKDSPTHTTIRPLNDRIVVRREKGADRIGNIALPDSAVEKPQRARVIAVGPGRWNIAGTDRVPLDVKEGDTVIFAKWAGHEIEGMGQDVVCMSEADILAVVEEGDSP